MNFNSLPNETLQRIVDLCHEADEMYKTRREKDEAKPGRKKVLAKGKTKGISETLNYDEWWGRSCSAISMVNKTLRLMAIKHLFTVTYNFPVPLFVLCLAELSVHLQTLKLSKEQADVFQFAILGAPTGNCITTVIFDYSPRHADNSVLFFVCRTMPYLPNLRTITRLTNEFSRQLQLKSTTTEATRLMKSRRAREAFAHIAKHITSWDFTLEEAVVEFLLSQNYGGIDSLTLRSPLRHGFPILESENSEFPSILYECSNLHSLSIVHTHEFEEQIVEPVDSDILIDFNSFPFLDSLRSLTLDLERFDGRTTSNEFDLATLFPSLESLKFTFRSNTLDEIKSNSFLLPKLTSLEIVDCPVLHLHVLILCLNLPSITSIALSYTSARRYESTFDEEVLEMRKLVSELGAYSSSLEALRINSSEISRRAVEEFGTLKGDVTVEVNSEIVVFSNETADTRHRTPAQLSHHADTECQNDEDDGQEDHSASELSSGAYRPEVGIDHDLKSTKELLNWAQERVNGCEDVDDAGVEEVRRVLEPVKELKEWLED